MFRKMFNEIPADIKYTDKTGEIQIITQELPCGWAVLLKNSLTKNNQANIDDHGKELLILRYLQVKVSKKD